MTKNGFILITNTDGDKFWVKGSEITQIYPDGNDSHTMIVLGSGDRRDEHYTTSAAEEILELIGQAFAEMRKK